MNPRRFRTALVTLFVFLPACVTETSPPPPASFEDNLTKRFSACEAVVSEEIWRAEVIRLVNVERAKVGCDPLVENATLNAQANQFACEMIQYDFFGHVNPVTGTHLRDRAEEFGYHYQKIGENLAAVPPNDCTPADVIQYWIGSTGHRKNMLDPEFTEIGVGIRTGGVYGTYWVQEFGCPAPADEEE